ncbi:hypothetical protein BOX15_Mlig034150g1 [Macrostomum lignano]|uniref:Uncharacterized protein n=2 Tax=Macrostomum lignano TaxID=282301 RepID=A0A267FDW1_9PLAT|nr:hypothetical protein BOX15_Mlig034150g2 [Macrostomum lignano]PAA71938.1 hypothetical protein BOX15_Mlig034150g1 [Macrostomum lignano]
MPTESERHEVGQQAALHLERMIALRNSGRATQLEHLELEGPSALGGHFPHSDWFRSTGSRDIDEKQCISLPKNGLRISALDEWLPFKPYGLTFLLPLSDAVVQMFSNQAVKLRKLARLMQCAVELKRSALLRKRRGSAGWVKFAKIFIQGATIKSIMTMDALMQQHFPVYQSRKQQNLIATQSDGQQTTCCLFLSESVPDHANLLIGNQRTGPTRPKFGALRLRQKFEPKQSAAGSAERVHNEKRASLGISEPGRSGGFAKASDFLYLRCPAGRTAAASEVRY